MNSIRLGKRSVKILKLFIKKRALLSTYEINLLMNDIDSFVDNSDELQHLLRNEYIFKVPNEHTPGSSIAPDSKFRIKPKGKDYLSNIKYERWISIRDSIIFPMIVAFITTLLTLSLKIKL